MIINFKKQIQLWQAASVSLPILALSALIISDLIIDGMEDRVLYCILITFGLISIGFWTWTVWQMFNLVNYLSNVEANYAKIAKDLAETKELLRGEREYVGVRQRRKSTKTKRK